MLKVFNILVVLFIGVIIVGCSSSKHQELTNLLAQNSISVNHELFNNLAIKVTSEEELFALTDEQEQEFLGYYHKQQAKGEKAHVIVSNYLSNYLSNFTYYGANYTATQAMALKQGNCMSLAIFSVALARLTDIEFDFREVTSIPVFEQKNNLLLSSSHVQTRLYDPSFTPDKESITIIRPSVVIDYFPNENNIRGRYFSYHQFLSLYYQNMAADALVAGDLDSAFANAYTAHKYDTQSDKALNLLAVVHRRKGDIETAEKIYVAAIGYEPESISLMNNYAVLLDKTNRDREAIMIKEQLAELDDPNPYSWLEQAYVYKAQGKYHLAIKTYGKVIDLAPYVNEAYLGLYQSHIALGDPNKAQDALRAGLEWTYEPNQRSTFKYKLYGKNAVTPTSMSEHY
ncbi:tetratricopeptide repeat protein [Thalassotalea atypica]|uniref:tetratricopeptide repeat protein n=1 Tax=Thalassotalea atypica TaxID=2054316 RepID=UPI00257255DB|nr:hypothetical protein [Thalassotalea atypica]